MIVEHLKTSQFRCSNRPSLTVIQQNSPHCSLINTCLEQANSTRALHLRALTSSVKLQSELIQLLRYLKRSTTSSVSLDCKWHVQRMHVQEHDPVLCGSKAPCKGWHDFGQFIQKNLHIILFEDENDTLCIFQIDKFKEYQIPKFILASILLMSYASLSPCGTKAFAESPPNHIYAHFSLFRGRCQSNDHCFAASTPFWRALDFNSSAKPSRVEFTMLRCTPCYYTDKKPGRHMLRTSKVFQCLTIDVFGALPSLVRTPDQKC
ncbi:hypothetical protein CSKR_101863 [Clonorchis sinensis]|uniref:Uncharacterized protein n=1 Tax=Clonorchis sinensis TaxID=79923 RepID=A0A3R7CIU9_CLOSI|nr:hypothetical protein CSKR_101863 [Clonorchis sinensis]